MRLHVRAAHPDRFTWLEVRTDCVLSRNARAIEAVRQDGSIAGMVAYDEWTPASCRAHMAVDSPSAWRALLRPAFQYPFLEAGKQVLLGIIVGDNWRSLNLVQRFGFREAHRVHDGWSAGVDLVVVEMRREECRYLKEETHG